MFRKHRGIKVASGFEVISTQLAEENRMLGWPDVVVTAHKKEKGCINHSAKRTALVGFEPHLTDVLSA